MASTDVPIPGSLVLVDVAGHSTGLAHAGNTDVVLSPVPSQDANDPLNWTKGCKQLATFCLLLYPFTVGVALTSVYSVLVPISDATGISVSTLNAGTGYMFLLLGWGGLITQPLALAFGKRGVFLTTQLLSVAIVIWMAFITTSSSWIANKVIQGLVCSPVEMLVEIGISDLHFAHDRGFWIGLYAWILFGSNYVAPIIARFVNQSLGYKSVFYVSAGIQGAGAVFTFFFMEETNYVRDTTEKGFDVAPMGARSIDEESKDDSKNSPPPVVQPVASLNGTPTSYYRKLLFFNTSYTSLTKTWTMCYRPILLLRFPVIFWSGFMYGSALVWYNILNATTSTIFSAAPYNFRSSAVGLTYFGPLIGTTFSGFYSGWLADKFSLWFARRKNGVREPEDRLWLLALCVILCLASLILWGVGASRALPWGALVVGGGMSACSSAIAASLTISYLLDSYRDLSGEAMISVILVRNTLSFAIGYGITPWLTLGLQNTFISAAFVGMAINATFLIVLRYGKYWRTISRERYWRYVETSAAVH